MKTAIIVIADPQSATEEAAARVSNALAFAEKGKRQGDRAKSRLLEPPWPAELAKLDHPANALYNSVRDVVKGASCGCAAVFGATEAGEACGWPLVRENPIPGTPGLASVRRYLARAGIPSCLNRGRPRRTSNAQEIS